MNALLRFLWAITGFEALMSLESDNDAEQIAGLQALIDSGMAWMLEGSVGRSAMNAIENGLCTLGPVGHRDYWGNYVPSRSEVQPGTKGSIEYAQRLQAGS